MLRKPGGTFRRAVMAPAGELADPDAFEGAEQALNGFGLRMPGLCVVDGN